MCYFSSSCGFFVAASAITIAAVSAQTPNITSSPVSVNISLNRSAEFNCTYQYENTSPGTYTLLAWYANGNLTDDNEGFRTSAIIPVEENLRMSTLTVIAYLHNNNTNMTCIVATFSQVHTHSSTSDPALLLIQGLLESVSNFTVTLINSTTVLISWSPPFTLEGVPILGYNVTITTSGENETMLVEDTTLLYSIDHHDPENNFTVTVVPINEVGAGQPATHEWMYLNTLSSTISTTSTPPHISMYSLATSTAVSSHPSITLSATQAPETQPVVIAVGSVVAVIIILSISAAILSITCYLVVYKKKGTFAIHRSSSPQDVIPVSSNPLYEFTTMKLKKNSAYAVARTVSGAPESSQYDEIVHVAVQDQNNYIWLS